MNLRRALGKLVMGASRILPPPRGQALVAGAKAAFTLVTGRHTSVTRGPHKASAGRAGRTARPARNTGTAAKAGRDTPSERAGQQSPAKTPDPNELPRMAREDLARAERALERAWFSEAWRLTERLATEHPSSRKVLKVRAAALAWAGDAVEHAAVLHRLHMLREDPDVRREERAVVGRIVETTPGWLPRIPGPREPMLPASDDVVLYLVNASGSYVATASTERLRGNLREAVRAGLRPEVVTALGFPRALGVLEFARLDVVDGIPHHRLDLGPHYALDGPSDRLLRDTAWLAANLARQVRPAIVHVIPNEDGLGIALVGAALRGHFGIPLVYEGGPAGKPPVGDDSARRAAAVSAFVRRADHVIASDAFLRDRIVAGGVDPDRITIIAGADAVADYGSRLRGVYERLLATRPPRVGA